MFSTSTSGKGYVLLIRCGANLGNALDPRPISCKTYRFLQKFRCQLMNSCSGGAFADNVLQNAKHQPTPYLA